MREAGSTLQEHSRRKTPHGSASGAGAPQNAETSTVTARASGHGAFPCRHAWLPRAYQALDKDDTALADDAAAMVALGLGKNMVMALRFWIDVMRVAAPRDGRRFELTPFARQVLDPQSGFDPYLEDIRTLWLLHWNLASHVEAPILAWQFLLFRWQVPEICPSDVVTQILAENSRRPRPLSRVTVEQNVDIFLHSYVASARRTAAALEDGLDCPLADLDLVQEFGERRLGTAGRTEMTYAFRRERKSEISDALFAYCLADFWNVRHRAEKTLTFRDVALAEGSLGQVFKLPEDDLRERLERLADVTDGAFKYAASAAKPMVVRGAERTSKQFLKAVYSDAERRDA
ncbi:MAG: DUF4007 family protein [Polyangiaceae bacterium]